MATINICTNGKPIKPTYSNVWKNPKTGSEMAYMDLSVGDMEVCIKFQTCQEMIEFCQKHNFDYDDDRKEQRKTA